MRGSATLIGAVLAALLVGGAALADPLPMPETDYVATMRTPDSSEPTTVRHHEGVLRMEGTEDGQSYVVLLDLASQTMIVLLEAEGQKIAAELPSAGMMPTVEIDGEIVGSDMVAGEACDVWRYTDPVTGLEAESCITDDGIMLRDRRPGEATNLDVTALERAAQDPALFTVPADYTRMPADQVPFSE